MSAPDLRYTALDASDKVNPEVQPGVVHNQYGILYVVLGTGTLCVPHAWHFITSRLITIVDLAPLIYCVHQYHNKIYACLIHKQCVLH